MADLRPLGGPAVLSLEPGQSLRFDFPSPVPAGYAAVVVFNQGGVASTANALSFTQAVPGPGAPVDAVP